MNWYVAEALFSSAVEPQIPTYLPLMERTYFLVSADSEEGATEKAVTLARSKEHSYANADGETVQWSFVNLERVREVMDETLRDGTEVWSVIYRAGAGGDSATDEVSEPDGADAPA